MRGGGLRPRVEQRRQRPAGQLDRLEVVHVDVPGSLLIRGAILTRGAGRDCGSGSTLGSWL
jgi:hypothetical protein